MIKKAIVFVALVALATLAWGADNEKASAKKRLLLITESKGFRHGCVARHVSLAKDADMQALAKLPGVRVQTKKAQDGKVTHTAFYDGRLDPPKELELKIDGKVAAVVKPCLVEKTFVELGKSSGTFDVVCSQDSRTEITAENLKNFDAVFFYTTGELPLSDTQKADLLSFIKNGKGFAGSHSATDTFYRWPEYGKLIGGYFDGHPWTRKVKVIVEDTKHPATKHLGESFEIDDEIYQFKTPYSRDKLRVLMRMDRGVDRPQARLNGKPLTDKDALEVTYADGKPTVKVNGATVDVKDLTFQGPLGNRKDRDNALAWI